MEEKTRELTELTLALIDLPSENHPPYGDEKDAQAYIAEKMRGIGLETDVFTPESVEGYEDNPEYLHERDTADRPDVVGVWKGTGGGRSLILCGHMDVAPKEPLPWTVCEPFSGIVKDGRIYGRGSADMKAGLACAYTAVKRLKESGFVPKGDIILESVVDEEYASGNGTIAACCRGYSADMAVVFEPTGLAVCPANVGGVMVLIRIQGNPGMPYTGEKVFNIAYALADMLKVIEKFEEDREAAPCPPLWEDAVQKRKIVITKVKAGEVQPHGQLSSPIDAWIECSVQTYPGESVKSVLAELDAAVKAGFRHTADVEITPLYHYVEPADNDPGYPGIKMLLDCLSSVTGKPEKPTVAPFPCDLFLFQKIARTPGVVFGPAGGNLHGPDEWADIESMEKTVQTMVEYIKAWCG